MGLKKFHAFPHLEVLYFKFSNQTLNLAREIVNVSATKYSGKTTTHFADMRRLTVLQG